MTDDTSSSADAATDSAWPAVSRSDADISFSPLRTPSTAEIWTPAPSATSSVVRAMTSAEPVTSAAWSRITPGSNADERRSRGWLIFRCAPWSVLLGYRHGGLTGRRNKVVDLQQFGNVENEDHAVADRRDAAQIAAARAGQPLGRRLDQTAPEW